LNIAKEKRKVEVKAFMPLGANQTLKINSVRMVVEPVKGTPDKEYDVVYNVNDNTETIAVKLT